MASLSGNLYAGEDTVGGGKKPTRVGFTITDPEDSFDQMTPYQALNSRHLRKRFPNVHIPGTSSYVRVTTLCLEGSYLLHDDGVRYIILNDNSSLYFEVEFYVKKFNNRFDRDNYLGSHTFTYRRCDKWYVCKEWPLQTMRLFA